MSDAEFGTIVRENSGAHGRLPALRFLVDDFIEGPLTFRLDDLIALHRGGKYILPGRRVDLSWVQYADPD